MAKVVFFFTSDFPYGSGETFIENELEYMEKTFDKIIIVSNNTSSGKTRKINSNICVERKSYELSLFQKLLSFINILSSLFWKELKIIRNTYNKPLTIPIINTALQSLQKSKKYGTYIIKLIEKYNVASDNIYLYSYWNNDIAFALARFIKHNSGIKAFCRMHGWDVYFEANEINYLPFRKYIFENLDRVFSISEDGILYIKRMLKENFNSIALSRLGVKEQKKPGLLNNNSLHIVSISNLIPVKQVDLLIYALSKLTIDFSWTHIGDGFLRNDLERLGLKHIQGKYTFLGSKSNTDVLNYFKKTPIDIFINVSKSEGIPVSIMEALSFGIPCIATAVGGTPEIVNNENGFLLSPNPDSEEIAGTINAFYYLSDTEKNRKREAAFKTWKTYYNAEKNYLDFVQEILQL